MRWMLLALLLLVQMPAARALTITYVSISESISAFQVCAIAGSHGSGPCDAASATGASTTFNQQRAASATDADNDVGALAIATGSVGQAAFLNNGGMMVNGSAVTGAQVFVSDSARADAVSEFKTAFFTDEDARFSLDGRVECEGDCTSFVVLYGPENESLFDLTITEGSKTEQTTVTLLANRSYLLWARGTSVASLAGHGFDTGRGDFSVAVVFGNTTVPGIPEPGVALLLVTGLAGMLAFKSGRLRATVDP